MRSLILSNGEWTGSGGAVYDIFGFYGISPYKKSQSPPLSPPSDTKRLSWRLGARKNTVPTLTRNSTPPTPSYAQRPSVFPGSPDILSNSQEQAQGSVTSLGPPTYQLCPGCQRPWDLCSEDSDCVSLAKITVKSSGYQSAPLPRDRPVLDSRGLIDWFFHHNALECLKSQQCT